MIPNNLDKEKLSLPKADLHSIVIITGSEDRHKRFALRMQQEFSDLIISWYEIGHDINKTVTATKKLPFSTFLKKIIHAFRKKGIRRAVQIIREYVEKEEKQVDLNKETIDTDFFKEELLDLNVFQFLEPVKITPVYAKTDEFAELINKQKAYFLLTLGGLLHSKKLIESVSGVAINQHAGHSPELKGSETHLWALYHRDLLKLSSTIHITSSGADSGSIFRRTLPCIAPSDTIKTIFNKVVILGTELMIEVVRDIISGEDIFVYPQEKYKGRTCMSADKRDFVLNRIQDDFDNGWLQDELERLRTF